MLIMLWNTAATMMSTAINATFRISVTFAMKKKNSAAQRTCYTYSPTKMWLIALGKNGISVSEDPGYSRTQMKRYL